MLKRHASSSHHLERTANEPRAQYPYWATIRDLWQITPTIRGVRLEIEHNEFKIGQQSGFGKAYQDNEQFSFAPGQWVDFIIPNTRWVGGYSIVSLPKSLPLVDLAVKYSKHPPAKWVTQKAQVGDRIMLKVGGKFVYPQPKQGESAKLLLVAGGIGINPLYGMLQNLLQSSPNSKIVLLYAAKSVDELAFRPEIQKLTNDYPETFRVLFSITDNDFSEDMGKMRANYVQELNNGQSGMMQGRIGAEQLGSSAEWLVSKEQSVDAKYQFCNDRVTKILNADNEIDVLVCGPPGMPEDIKAQCSNLGINPESVRFEKWW